MVHSTLQRKKNMSISKTILKRSALAVFAAVLALSWTQTGHTQSPCLIERGQDPLDVLNFGVRHNVWIVLDTSGSMSGGFGGGQNKIQAARDVLKEIVDEFVDASGRPLVNWGFVQFAQNSNNSTTACNAQFPNNCVGLAINEMVNPPSCNDPANSTVIKNKLNAAANPLRGGLTPNGISMDQISQQIVSNNYVANLLPNQKNFVILVSDGDDTCECSSTTKDIAGKMVNGIWTPTPVPPFLASNTIPSSLRGSATPNSAYTVNAAGNSGNIQAANAGTKGRLAYERLNPSPTDRATGAKGGAFVVGMGLTGASVARTNHMAWESSGAFYGNPNATSALFANDKAGLKQALRDAFARIGIPPTTVTLGAPTVGSVREVIPQYTNSAVTPDMHYGEVGPSVVDTDDIREARQVRGAHQNNVAFYSSVDVPGFKGYFKAYNIYRVTDPANPHTARVADFTPIWDAGAQLQQTAATARNVLVNKRGSTALVPFDASNVTAADLGVGAGYLGALTANDARDMVIGVVRGLRLSEHPFTGTYYTPTGQLNFSTTDASGNPMWKLYDAIAAPAVVGNPPRSPDFDPPQNHAPEYGVGGTKAGDGFYWDHFNRPTMVYLPTNGGMLHGFDGQTGNELFAYIPDDVLGMAPGEVSGSRDTLKDFVQLVVDENNGIQNHQFLMAGSPTVRDAFLRYDNGGDNDWHTVLSFGRGRAGRFMSVLDVTDPYNPKLRFNVGNREGINDGLLDGMGETWSTPVMGNVLTDPSGNNADKIDQWLAFFGAGYGCNNANKEGQYLYALRVEDGAVYKRSQVSNNAAAPVSYNAVVGMPMLYNPHQEDVADNKDYVTRVYVGDLQGGIWKLVTTATNPNSWSFVKFAEMGLDQPISAPLALLPDVNNSQIYVMAGSGGDSRIPSGAATFRFATFLDKDAEGANTTQYPLGSSPFWSRDLNPDERVYVAPVAIGKVGDPVPPVVFFAASRPFFNAAVCEGTFYSSLWALGIESGQAEVDLDGGGNDESVSLGENKITGLYSRDGNLYVSESGGLGASGSLTVYGDGSFADDIGGGAVNAAVQFFVESVRISPF
jgi:hypothetical protein